MKKSLSILLILSLILLLLTGCGTKSPSSSKDDTVKTGLAVISTTDKSKDATATVAGLAEVDSIIAAVTVDNSGKIVKCVIDAIQSKINFSAVGKVTTDLKTTFKTKNELGTEYGMKKASKIGKEWNEEAAAFANYAVGKTVQDLKGISVNADGAPTVAELTSSVTISIGDFISTIEKAVNNAKALGAKASDKLGVGAVTSIDGSKDAGAADGVAQAYSYYTATTFDANNKITSNSIDASQTNVTFSAVGKITSDLKAVNKTKNELGTEYGMKKASKIGKEWNEEAAAFANYAVGKTVQDLKGISVNADGAPTVAELTSSVTISIGDFMVIIEKASTTAK